MGIEPCQIFYIGGAALCEMQWDINCIGDIIKAAARSSAGPQSPARWSCCESERNNTQYGDFLEDWRGKPIQLEMNLNSPLAKWIAWRCDRAPCFFAHMTAVAAEKPRWMTAASGGEPARLEEREVAHLRPRETRRCDRRQIRVSCIRALRKKPLWMTAAEWS